MLTKLLSLFLKSNCPLCQRPADHILCPYCHDNLQTCQLSNCREFWQGDLPVFIWGNYTGYLKRAIASLKYDLHQEIGEILGEWLAKAWLKSGLYNRHQKITVVPIPLHQKKQAQRGFNQAELIARSFCQITRYELKPNLLTRIRRTEAMFGLSATQRQKNIHQAFGLGKDELSFNSNSSVLILDDIYTTGTTVKEACRVLQSSKIKIWGVMAIAKPLKDKTSSFSAQF
jgi:ComF family protein